MTDLHYEIAEIKRQLASFIRLGTVAAVQTSPPRVKVAVGDLTTGWRPWMEQAAGVDTTWDPPSEGEQVVLLSPFGDMNQGVVLRGLNQAAHPAPETSLDKVTRQFGDGSFSVYDRASHTLTLDIKGPVNVTAQGNVDVTSQGKATVKASGGIDLSGDGSEGLKGAINGHCLCPLTGQPHMHISATVRSSK
ncbi:phage baseplate assembly protein V [Desulfoluna butyratoxydans]|uniref:Phage baseplate assembly protein v/gp45 n=1 Tax=Desulfoluna butyratoxydans TaxID=231438 RepID=A0A4U8YLR0_9BACT|nr:phage baseplate assembly protein V [Desulfoluna butyratoxydans]VFQ44384.1 phage baseplate assembly protein v/gp45 [Desulfoluna butyratoxydans]